MTASVAICTFNRADSLARTLESLTGQKGKDSLDWELLLIDNKSSDATAQVAKSFTDRLPLRYIFEGTQGLSAARNRALREFRGELLVFTDDDVVLDSKWLAAWKMAAETHPNAGYFGGRILPLWENNRPNWLVDPSLPLISGLLVHYDLGKDTRGFGETDPLPFGANFAVRRQLVEQLVPFRLDLGVRGGSSGRGEEAEYLQRARQIGSRGVYVGAAVCYHTQDPERFTFAYLYRYGIEKGRAAALMRAESGGSLVEQLEFAVKGLAQLARGRGDRFRQCIINMGIQRGLMLMRNRELKPQS